MIDQAQPLPYQVEGVRHLVSVLNNKPAALEASGTGYGKTYVSLFAAEHLKLRPAIVCTKPGIFGWQEACELIGIEPLFITNYEQVKLKKFQHGGWKRKNQVYEWNLPDNTLLIFDECHKMKNPSTQNSKVGIAGTAVDKILLLSATCASSPMDMFAMGIILGLFDTKLQFRAWKERYGVKEGQWGEFFDNTEPWHMVNLHKVLFPDLGHRVRVSDIPDFPKNHITTIQVKGKETPRVAKYLKALDEIRLSDEPLPIVDLLRARQEAEVLKVYQMIEDAEELLNEGYSVVFFVCFSETFTMIQEAMGKLGVTSSLIHGKQTGTQRIEEMKSFQDNTNHACICQIRAGGESINLHDLHGRPRASLMSPSYSAEELIQALGRICRANSKSPAIQRMYFCAGTVEEKVRRAVQNKVKNIDLLNDGDVNPFER
jgi:superfamily II DNA or RNA helicase|tara:strand:- start:4477 stop:5763 length:1287 start_codon:yes stop_codon:yes gene_type:complete